MRILFILSFVILSTTALLAQDDKADIKEAFEGYKSSVINSNGADAVQYVSQSTIDYYGEIQKHATSSKKKTLKSLRYFDQFMVLTIRHRTPKAILIESSPKELLGYAIDKGMVDGTSIASTGLGKIRIDGDYATAKMVNDGISLPTRFEFSKENGEWKFDLNKLINNPLVNSVLKKTQEESGMDESEFILMILEASTGQKPSKKIWKRVK